MKLGGYNGKRKEIKNLVTQAIEAGLTAQEILTNGMMAGMDIIGGKFIRDEVFVPEVLVAARAMNTGTERICCLHSRRMFSS